MRLKSHPVPAWANRLIDQICTEEGVRKPSVTWQKVGRAGTSGVAWTHSIRMTVGTDRKNAKEALIHEMCHVVLGQTGALRGNRGHDAEFYAKLFEVGKRHRVGAAYIKARENGYKPRGVKAGYRLYLAQNRQPQATTLERVWGTFPPLEFPPLDKV